MTKIKEIFESIQGEGPYVGVNQIFVRFCACNLNCQYCDTEFLANDNTKDYTPQALANFINKNCDLKRVHSISLTGGEPLLFTGFLKEFLPLINLKTYLETNATLPDKLAEILDMTDIIAADIKLESATGIKNSFEAHEKFFEIAKTKKCFAKVVFNDKITDSEINRCCQICKKYDIPIVLQPEMLENKMTITPEFAQNILKKFLTNYPNTRLIPQTHKLINVR